MYSREYITTTQYSVPHCLISDLCHVNLHACTRVHKHVMNVSLFDYSKHNSHCQLNWIRYSGYAWLSKKMAKIFVLAMLSTTESYLSPGRLGSFDGGAK